MEHWGQTPVDLFATRLLSAVIAGLMATYGRVSRKGVIPYSFSLDHCGPMAWTAEDCAIMLQAIAGYDSDDPGSTNLPVPDYTAALTRGNSRNADRRYPSFL